MTEPMSDAELAEIRESSGWAISANNALRLLAEVDRLRAERDSYKKAKAENDERLMLERDAAREDVRWLLSEFGSEHWRDCDDSGCYLCEGYEEINKRYTSKRQTNGS